MYKKILIVSVLLFGFSLAFYLSKEKERLGAVIPKEVPMYYEDMGDIKYFKVSNKIETEITANEYKNIELKEGEHAGGRPIKKLTILKNGEFYKTGKTDVGSTTYEVVLKESDVQSIKMLSEL